MMLLVAVFHLPVISPLDHRTGCFCRLQDVPQSRPQLHFAKLCNILFFPDGEGGGTEGKDNTLYLSAFPVV